MSTPGATIGRRPIRAGEAVAEVEPGAAGASVDDGYERLFVYGVLAASAVALITFVGLYGRDLPFWDEWEFVSVLAGEQPATFSWVWQFHNEHRVPLVRLVMLGAWRLGLGHQAVMFVTAALLVAIAVLLVETARRLRGRMAYTDAVLAIAFLQWGHYENLIFGMQFFFVCASVLACACLAIVALDGWRANTRVLTLFGALLVLLPLNGAMGVAYALPLAIWAAVAAVARVREADAASRRDSLLLGAAALTTAALLALYMWGFARGSAQPPSPMAIDIASTVVELFSVAIGPAGRLVWPASGLFVVGLALFAGVHALGALYVKPGERLRALGLLLGLGGFVGLAFLIGYARAGLGPAQGFSDRYMILTVPIVCVAYLIALLYMPPARRAFVCTCVATAMALLLAPGYREGRGYGAGRASRADAVVSDARRGVPSTVIAKRHFAEIYPNESVLAERLEVLRRTRQSLFAGSQASLADCAQRTQVEIVVNAANDAAWSSPVAIATGPDPYIVLELGAQRHVCAVEVTYSIDRGEPGSAALTAYWMRTGVNDFSGTERFETLDAQADNAEHTSLFWINDVVDRLRLDPDGPPTRLTIHSVLVVEP